jgi:hypothetical protein
VTPSKQDGALGRLVSFALQRIDEVDDAGAVERVRTLREQHPSWTDAQFVEHLVNRKCQQAAAVGAATAGSGLIPGVGTLAALTVGTVADVGATLKLQTELALEIAAVYGRRLSPAERRRAFLLIGGLTLGKNRALSLGGARLSLRLGEQYAQHWLAHALPFAGVAAAAGVDVLTTYTVGRRADAYFRLGPQAMGSWAHSLRALTGVDERRLASWLGERTGRAWRAPRVERARVRLSSAGNKLAGAAQSAGSSAAAGAQTARRGLAATAGRGRRLLPGRPRTAK